MSSRYNFIDLSHTIYEGLVTYKGLAAPIVCDYLSREASKQFYEEGTTFQIGKIEMVTNTGTYLDCPFHRYADGKDLSELLLENLADIPAFVIRAPYTNALAIDKSYFEGRVPEGSAVLVNTGWDVHWDTEMYYENNPFLTKDAADYLVSRNIKIAGIDSLNIDDTRGRSRPVHSALLGAGILITEHLCNLAALPASGFTFSAVPPKFKGVGTFPVRAFAKVPV